MTHPRKAIRHHVVDLLSGAIPEVGERVFRSRSYPMQRQELPGICVYTLREPAERANLPGHYDRLLDLAIDIYVRSTDEPDDDLDDLAEAVEALMESDITLGRKAVLSSLAETTIGFDGQGERANGLARLRYTIRYRSSPA